MMIFPDIFTPYIKGRETAIAANWNDRNEYNKVEKDQISNLFDNLSFDDRLMAEKYKTDYAKLVNDYFGPEKEANIGLTNANAANTRRNTSWIDRINEANVGSTNASTAKTQADTGWIDRINTANTGLTNANAANTQQNTGWIDRINAANTGSIQATTAGTLMNNATNAMSLATELRKRRAAAAAAEAEARHLTTGASVAERTADTGVAATNAQNKLNEHSSGFSDQQLAGMQWLYEQMQPLAQAEATVNIGGQQRGLIAGQMGQFAKTYAAEHYPSEAATIEPWLLMSAAEFASKHRALQADGQAELAARIGAARAAYESAAQAAFGDRFRAIDTNPVDGSSTIAKSVGAPPIDYSQALDPNGPSYLDAWRIKQAQDLQAGEGNSIFNRMYTKPGAAVRGAGSYIADIFSRRSPAENMPIVYDGYGYYQMTDDRTGLNYNAPYNPSIPGGGGAPDYRNLGALLDRPIAAEDLSALRALLDKIGVTGQPTK